MSKGLGCLAAVVVVVIILAVIVGGSYNRLVGLSQGVDAQWAQVESVYQRRADLIPNLVATVQGAANFEKSTLEAVTKARASVGQAAPWTVATRLGIRSWRRDSSTSMSPQDSSTSVRCRTNLLWLAITLITSRTAMPTRHQASGVIPVPSDGARRTPAPGR